MLLGYEVYKHLDKHYSEWVSRDISRKKNYLKSVVWLKHIDLSLANGLKDLMGGESNKHLFFFLEGGHHPSFPTFKM